MNETILDGPIFERHGWTTTDGTTYTHQHIVANTVAWSIVKGYWALHINGIVCGYHKTERELITMMSALGVPVQPTDGSEMSVFSIHDDPGRHCSEPLEAWWCLIAAETVDQALAIAAAVYNGDGRMCESRGDRWRGFFGVGTIFPPVEVKKLLGGCYPHPMRLDDTEELRAFGFQEEGEHSCDSCGLFAMGLERFQVCDKCYLCRTCKSEMDDPCEGCDDDSDS